MKLIPFTQEHYSQLIGWLPDALTTMMWGGLRYNWPLTNSQIAQYLDDVAVHPCLFIDSNSNPIGYIELVEKPHSQVTLCRILIADPNARSKGYGTKLIEQAIDKAQNELAATTIELGVFEQNTSARRCYKKLGFEVYQCDETTRFNDQVWSMLRMKKQL